MEGNRGARPCFTGVGYLLLPPKLEFRYCLTLLGEALLLLRRFYQVPVAIPEVGECAISYETHTLSKPLRGVWDKYRKGN